MGMFKDWNNKNSLEKVMTILSVVFMFIVVILVFLQLFNVWKYALSVAELLLILYFVFQGIAEFRTRRHAAFVCFGGAFIMLIMYLSVFIR